LLVHESQIATIRKVGLNYANPKEIEFWLKTKTLNNLIIKILISFFWGMSNLYPKNLMWIIDSTKNN
jgi:hypothetical protein